MNKNNVAPRLGLAYQLTDKTVIRAAAGIFYTHNELWGIVDRPVANPPFRAEATFPSDQLTPNLIVRNGFPADALTRAQGGASLISFEQDFRSGYTGQWNFSLQRRMPGNLVIEAAYVGSNSVKLPIGRDINQPLPGPGPLAPRRRFPAFGSITRFEDMGKSNFHSLQLKLEKRYSSFCRRIAAIQATLSDRLKPVGYAGVVHSRESVGAVSAAGCTGGKRAGAEQPGSFEGEGKNGE